MIQGSDEWVRCRLGHVSASRFSDVMTNGRGGGLSKTAETYMLDLISEHLTGKPASTLKTFAMDWGTRWEPVAREAYRERTSHEVVECGFVRHGTEQFIGCSPDGIVAGDFLNKGSIEIKCPLTPANHTRVIMNGEMPAEHFEQVQGVIWLTSSRWCDFVSYHDDFPTKWRLLVVRVHRDDDYIEQLRCKVLAFRDEMVSRLKTSIERWE